MLERGDRPRLALETLEKIGVLRQMWQQHLDRDDAIDARIVAFVHFPHTPDAN